MAAYWLWWIGAAVLVGLELATGTFYLLAVGLAFAVGGLAALLGAELPLQLTIGGVLTVVGVIVAHQWRKRHATPASMQPLDQGQSVHVAHWKPDGSARVDYRGTQWDAVLASADAARAHTMYIVATRGSTLVLSDRRP